MPLTWRVERLMRAHKGACRAEHHMHVIHKTIWMYVVNVWETRV